MLHEVQSVEKIIDTYKNENNKLLKENKLLKNQIKQNEIISFEKQNELGTRIRQLELKVY